jgi:hypothetical protein
MDELKNLENLELKRDPDYIKRLLEDNGSNIITKKDLYVFFPQKFVDRDLTSLGNTCYILGLIAIVDLDKGVYSVLTLPTRLEMQPSEINNTVINGMDYVVLKIDKDSDFLVSKKVVKESDFVFDIMDLLLIKGKVPWYYDYNDIVKIFANVKKYTGEKAADNQLTFELLTAMIARDATDWNKYYRDILESMDDLNKKELAWVGLENIWFSFRSTLSKLAGAYMKKGIVSAIINPEKEISDLEHVLRE